MEARIGWLSVLAVVAYGMAQPGDAIAVGAARGSAAPVVAGGTDPDAVPASATATAVADADTYIVDVEPDRGWGAEDLLQVGRWGDYMTGFEVYRSLLRFQPLPSLPDGARVLDATLRLYAEAGAAGQLEVCRAGAEWTEYTVTWRNQPTFLEPCTAAPIGASAGWYEVGVTDIVSQWLSGSRNHGFLLKAEAQALNNRRGFHSRQRYNAPLMVITYTIPPPDSTTVSGLADADTYILDREPDRGWGAEDLLLVGQYGNYMVPNVYRSLVRFNPLPRVPAGARVTGAALRLYAEAGPAATIEVCRASSTWGEYTATWNNQPGAAAPCVSSTIDAGEGWRELTVTDLVLQWAAGVPNHGFVMKAVPESASVSNRRSFHSRQRFNVPSLVLTYTAGGTPSLSGTIATERGCEERGQAPVYRSGETLRAALRIDGVSSAYVRVVYEGGPAGRRTLESGTLIGGRGYTMTPQRIGPGNGGRRTLVLEAQVGSSFSELSRCGFNIEPAPVTATPTEPIPPTWPAPTLTPTSTPTPTATATGVPTSTPSPAPLTGAIATDRGCAGAGRDVRYIAGETAMLSFRINGVQRARARVDASGPHAQRTIWEDSVTGGRDYFYPHTFSEVDVGPWVFLLNGGTTGPLEEVAQCGISVVRVETATPMPTPSPTPTARSTPDSADPLTIFLPSLANRYEN